MIYTSYFSKLKKLPKDIIPIAICGSAPKGYQGLQYKKLAPKYDFFTKWKQDHNNEYYIKCFSEQVLSKLKAEQVIRELLILAGNYKGVMYSPDICLVCYEKSDDFCHRHLVASWLRDNGYECEEWMDNGTT
jgi:hypothetical protein